MANRFAATQGSETAALNTVGDEAVFLGVRNLNAIASGSSSTAAAAAFLFGVYSFSGGSTYTLTTPSAAQIVAAIPNAQVGSACTVRLYNANSGTLTLTAGSGITVIGPTTVATTKALGYDVIVTNATAGAEAVTLVAHTYAAA